MLTSESTRQAGTSLPVEAGTEEATPSPTRPNRPKRSKLVRTGFLVVTGLALWHVFASFLWIGPVTALRDLVPGNLLTRYMIPWFGQSWSVFAPAPINGEYRFEVRALLADADGTETVTEWISVTDAETSMSHHNLFPPRAANMSIGQASSMKGAWDKLTPAQQEIAELNYFNGDDWLGRMQIAMNESNNSQNAGDVAAYIVQERRSDAYATQVAKAVWGEDVQQVQYQASRQNIIPFAERHDSDAERPAVQRAVTGWRGTIVMPGQSEDAFADVFLPAHQEVTNND